MNTGRIRSSPPLRKRTRVRSPSYREHDDGGTSGHGRDREVYRDVRQDDGLLILVKKGTTFFPPPASSGQPPGESRGQLQGSNWTSFQHPIAIPSRPTETPSTFYRKEPSTTYQRSSHKPYPYDNTTMLTDPPRYQRPLRISRLLDAPSHLLRSMQTENQAPRFPASRSLHTSHSNTNTQVLFHSKLPYQQSEMTTGTVTPSQLASQFSTTFISRREDKGGREIRHFIQERSPVVTPTSSSSETNMTAMTDAKAMRNRLRELRSWEYTTFGRLVGSESDRDHASGGTRFSILCYNILAQQHLENHKYLYKGCQPERLTWSERFPLLLKEIGDFSPDIICLQEVEETEFHQNFTPALSRSGYRGVFKRRSGGKPDGCAIFWNAAMFSLAGKLALDLRQGHVPLLNRDNVALMVKLEPKSGRTRQRLVVATTHLLYNPKRNDVKLAQAQLLLAELDRFSFAGFGRQGESLYMPTLLCGDFNTEPHSSVSTLITEGTLRYLDKNGTTPKVFQNRGMDNYLPVSVGINDQCQHYKLQLERVKQWKSQSRGPIELDRKTQLALINVQSEGVNGPPNSAPSKMADEDQDTPRPNTIESYDPDGHEQVMNEIRKFGIPCTFGTGTLTHDLKLRNIYEQSVDNRKETRESVATTRQSAWKCVDFIFQGMQLNPVDGQRVEGSLKLIRRLRLLSKTECKELGHLPNFASPSDHYPLLAEFQLK